MTGATPTVLGKKAQEGVLEFFRQCTNLNNTNWNIRENLQDLDRAYMREFDQTEEQAKAQIANRLGDTNRFQNIQMPVVMPAVEAAVTYQASVFLTGNPIFGVVSSPEYADQALQMETKIENEQIRGGWVRQLIMFFRDGFKYNLSAIEVPWERTVVPSFETDISFAGGKQGKPKDVLFEGNCIKKMDMYNTFWDTRVPITEVYRKGEFAGYTELYSRIGLKQFLAQLPEKIISNVTAAFESGTGYVSVGSGTYEGQGFYIPDINPASLINRQNYNVTDWMAWAGVTGADRKAPMQYRNLYTVTTLYGRILPSDFGMQVPNASTPQVWKFILVNGQVLIYAERQSNAHGWIPMLFGQPIEDGLGLGYQTKSLAQNVSPIQSVSTALMNSVIASRRRAISDRMLYDPSKVTEAHINSPNPSAKIPVRPSAYGKNPGEAVFQIPYRDENSQEILRMLPGITSLANTITGQNPVRQGQFVKGNKTRSEFDTVMDNANGRDQLQAMMYESQVFTPLKYIIKTNILQYQGGISLYNSAAKTVVEIDPVALRKAVLEFKVSDGLTPSEKLIDADSLTVALNTITNSPQIGRAYNAGPLFSYLMKSRGAEISAFEKSPNQVAYEDAMAVWSSTCQEIAKSTKEGTPKFPPQPKPQDYGYDPAQQSKGANPSTPVNTNGPIVS